MFALGYYFGCISVCLINALQSYEIIWILVGVSDYFRTVWLEIVQYEIFRCHSCHYAKRIDFQVFNRCNGSGMSGKRNGVVATA